MTRRGLRNRVIVKRVRVERAAAVEPGQPAGELRLEAREVVGSHLVDGDEHQKRRRRRGGVPGVFWAQATAGKQPEDEADDERATHSDGVKGLG